MNEKLTFADVIDLLAKKAKISKKDAESFLRELFAIIYDNILETETVKVKDFGSFKPTLISSRESVDVNTGLKIQIPAHYRLTFSPDKTLKDLVNKPFASFESIILDDTTDIIPSFATETGSDNLYEEEEEVMSIPLTENETKFSGSETAKSTEKNKPEEKPAQQAEQRYTQTIFPVVSSSYNYSYVPQDNDGEEKTIITVPITKITPHSQPQTAPPAIVENIVTEGSPAEDRQSTADTDTSDKQINIYEIIDDNDLDNMVPLVSEEENQKDDDFSVNMPPPLPFLQTEGGGLSTETVQAENKTPAPAQIEVLSNIDEGGEDEDEIVVPHIQPVTPENKYISEERIIVPDDVLTFKYTSNEPEQSAAATANASEETTATEKLSPPSTFSETTLSDIEKDNDNLNDQEDFVYPDYDAIYEEEDKKRKLFRIVPYVLLGIVLLIISILGFLTLIERINKSKNTPYYNSANLVDSDTIPGVKKEKINFTEFQESENLSSAAKETARQLELLKNSNDNPPTQTPTKDSDKQTKTKVQPSGSNNLQQPQQKTVEKKSGVTNNTGDTSPKENTKKNNQQATHKDSELQISLNKAHEKFESKKTTSTTQEKVGQQEVTSSQPAKNIATVVLKQGESLRTISAKYYGKREYWVYLYKENRNRISNPNNVPVGTKLVIPDLSKYVGNPQDPNSVEAAKNIESQIIKK